jgi:hypothetical protein
VPVLLKVSTLKVVSIGTIKITGSVSKPSTILARWLYPVLKEILESIKPDLVACLPIGKDFFFLSNYNSNFFLLYHRVCLLFVSFKFNLKIRRWNESLPS